MSIVFMEGFDLYNGVGTNVGVQSRWTYYNGTAGISSGLIAGRFGGQGLRVVPQGGYYLIQTLLPAAYAALTLGAAFRVTGLSVNTTFAWLGAGWPSQLSVGCSTTGELIVYRGDFSTVSKVGGSELGRTAPGKILINTWHYLELSATIAAAGGTVSVKIDGATVLTLTGQNTKALGSSGVDTLMLGASGGGAAVDFDDVYVTDSATPIGERRIETLRPTADTAQKDWSASAGASNWTQVDDGVCDGESTYVEAGAAGDRDLYELANLSTTPAVIDAVQPVLFARKSDAATRSAQVSLQSGGVDDDGAAFALSADYNAFRRLLTADPQDGTAWTKSRVDAVRLGPKVAA